MTIRPSARMLCKSLRPWTTERKPSNGCEWRSPIRIPLCAVSPPWRPTTFAPRVGRGARVSGRDRPRHDGRETLIDFAIDLAANNAAALQIAFSAQPKTLNRAIRALASRCGWGDVLRALYENGALSPDRKQQLLSIVLEGELRSSWSPSEVVNLTHMLMAQPNGLDELRSAREALDSQPVAAVLARLCYPPGEWLFYDIGRPVSILDDAGLTELFNSAWLYPASRRRQPFGPVSCFNAYAHSASRPQSAANRTDGDRKRDTRPSDHPSPRHQPSSLDPPD